MTAVGVTVLLVVWGLISAQASGWRGWGYWGAYWRPLSQHRLLTLNLDWSSSVRARPLFFSGPFSVQCSPCVHPHPQMSIALGALKQSGVWMTTSVCYCVTLSNHFLSPCWHIVRQTLCSFNCCPHKMEECGTPIVVILFCEKDTYDVNHLDPVMVLTIHHLPLFMFRCFRFRLTNCVLECYIKKCVITEM